MSYKELDCSEIVYHVDGGGINSVYSPDIL